MTTADDLWPNHRANVGIALFNAGGQVWLGRREGTPPPWNWQLPQGGMDKGEAAETAALRELEEETGIRSDRVEPLGHIANWIAYDYPPEIPDLIIPWKRDVYEQVVHAFARFAG